jgi:hypothetical protein
MAKKTTVPLWARNNATVRHYAKPNPTTPLWMRGNNERLKEQAPQDPVSSALAAYRKTRVRPPVLAARPAYPENGNQHITHRLTADRPEHWPERPSPKEFADAGYPPTAYEEHMTAWENSLRVRDEQEAPTKPGGE